MIKENYSQSFVQEYFDLPEGWSDTCPVATITIERSGHMQIKVEDKLHFLLEGTERVANKLRKIANFYDSDDFAAFLAGELDSPEGSVGDVKYLADESDIMIR